MTQYSVRSYGTIEKTFLGFEHGTFTFWFQLKLGDGSGQGFGGYRVNRTATIENVLDTLGVRSWEELIGMKIKVEHEAANPWGPILKIRAMKKDRWVDLNHDERVAK